MIGFYLRSQYWRQEKAYWDEIQAEEDLVREHKEERKQMDKEADEVWRKIHDDIDKEAFKRNLTDIDVMVIWNLGLAAWDASKKWGAKFPHE